MSGANRGRARSALLAVGAIVVALLGFGASASIAGLPSHDGSGEGAPPPEAWKTPARPGVSDECDAMRPEESGKSISVYDQGTGQVVEQPAGVLCTRAAAKAAPAEAQQKAGVVAKYAFRNGDVEVTYHELHTTVETGPDGIPTEHVTVEPTALAPDVAQARLAEFAQR